MSPPRKFDAQGKAALFSEGRASTGLFVVECSNCEESTRVSTMKLIRLAIPLNFTIPLRYYHTWMRCPACKTRAWVHIRLFE